MTKRRLTVAETADALGISQDAVRMRVKRGTLEAERDGRQVFVLLDSVGSGVGSHPDSSALISEMRERIAFLERELERKDAIMLNMTEAMKAIAPPAPQEPPGEAPEAPTGAREQPGRVEPQPAVESAQEAAQPRSWWRRMFGG